MFLSEFQKYWQRVTLEHIWQCDQPINDIFCHKMKFFFFLAVSKDHFFSVQKCIKYANICAYLMRFRLFFKIVNTKVI